MDYNKIIKHDGVVHHPRGGGSYVFGESFLQYLIKNITKNEIRISIGAQPNSSPHLGTLVVFSLAFAIAQKLIELSNKLKIKVFFEIVDTAPAKNEEINGINYQISLRDCGLLKKHITDYIRILKLLKKWSNIEYIIRYQSEFNELEYTKDTVHSIIDNKDIIAPILDPSKNRLRIRLGCPKCNRSDKDGENTIFKNSEIISYCPIHGEYKENYFRSVKRFEYNTPLRNLIRALVYSKQNTDINVPYEWIRLTGSDYAGFYQEQLLYKCASLLNVNAHNLPFLIYSPLITDWSGAKLSKSLYVNDNAYSYLPSYVNNYRELIKKFGDSGLKSVFLETINWINNPFKLFRNYSVYYFINIFNQLNV